MDTSCVFCIYARLCPPLSITFDAGSGKVGVKILQLGSYVIGSAEQASSQPSVNK